MISLTDSSLPAYELYASPERFRSCHPGLDSSADDTAAAAAATDDDDAPIVPYSPLILASEAAGCMANEDVAAVAVSFTDDDVSWKG